MTLCAQESPELREIEPGRFSACHLNDAIGKSQQNPFANAQGSDLPVTDIDVRFLRIVLVERVWLRN